MKGITPIIAIVLLLLITISMAGFAMVWFGQIAETAQNDTQSILESTLNTQCQRVAIDSIDSTNEIIHVKNIGTCNLVGSTVNIFFDGVLTAHNTGCTDATMDVAPGALGSCDFTVMAPGACTGSTIIRVSAAGGEDSTTC